MLIVDADDFCETNNRLDLLFQLKAKIPNFKINLFTIIGKCSLGFIEEIKKIDWIDMIPHGMNHPDPLEASKWTYKESLDYLRVVEPLGLTKGFKAPGWQISDGMYQALLEKGYWVADQPYNDNRRPQGLKAYILNSPNKLHFHIQNVCGNGLEESWETLINLPNEKYEFINSICGRQP